MFTLLNTLLCFRLNTNTRNNILFGSLETFLSSNTTDSVLKKGKPWPGKTKDCMRWLSKSPSKLFKPVLSDEELQFQPTCHNSYQSLFQMRKLNNKQYFGISLLIICAVFSYEEFQSRNIQCSLILKVSQWKSFFVNPVYSISGDCW